MGCCKENITNQNNILSGKLRYTYYGNDTIPFYFFIYDTITGNLKEIRHDTQVIIAVKDIGKYTLVMSGYNSGICLYTCNDKRQITSVRGLDANLQPSGADYMPDPVLINDSLNIIYQNNLYNYPSPSYKNIQCSDFNYVYGNCVSSKISYETTGFFSTNYYSYSDTTHYEYTNFKMKNFMDQFPFTWLFTNLSLPHQGLELVAAAINGFYITPLNRNLMSSSEEAYAGSINKFYYAYEFDSRNNLIKTIVSNQTHTDSSITRYAYY